jgi:DNA-nicking Smr family endonuclease
MSLRRSRQGPSEAERALWHAWAARAGVVPLPGRAPPAPPPAPPAPVVAASAPVPPLPRPAAAPLPELRVGQAPGGLDARRWRDLRRGRTRPERTLDLHGVRAHAAVHRFLLGARAEGLRCVAIVTGRGSSPEGGVLRRELPHWLNGPELRPLLLGAAHPHAANPGAVHLLLRRAPAADRGRGGR